MSIDEILEECRRIKGSGYAPRITVAVSVIERLCEDAAAWRALPETWRDGLKAMKR